MPDVVPLTPDEIRGLMEDPEFTPTREHASILLDDENARPLSETLKGAASGLWQGAKQVGSELAGAVTEPFTQQFDPLGMVNSVAEGAARGTYDLFNLGRQALTKTADTVLEKTGVVDREGAISNYYDRLLRNRAAAQTRQQNDGNILPWAAGDVAYPAVAQGLSNVLDPSIAVAPGLSGSAKAVKVAGGLGRKAAKAAEVVGEKTAAAAALPRHLAGKLVEKAVGPAAAKAAEKFINIAETAAIPATLAGVPTAKIPAALRVAETVGQGVEKAGQLAGKVSETAGASLGDKLSKLGRDITVPEWMRVVSSAAQTGVGRLATAAVEGAGRTTKAGAQGAAVGAGLGALTAETPEEFGAAVGSGGVMGAAAHVATSPLAARKRMLAARATDIKSFYDTQLAEGSDPAWLAKNVSDNLMLQAARAQRAFEVQMKVRFVDAATFDRVNPGATGAAGVHVSDGTVYVAPERSADVERTMLHEIGHALGASVAANTPEVTTLIQQAIEQKFPGQVDPSVQELKRQYAEKLVSAEGAPKRELEAATAEKVKLLDDRSAAQHGGDRDRWFYQEVFAELVADTLRGKDLKTDVLPVGLIHRAFALAEKVLAGQGVPPVRGQSPSAVFKGAAGDAVMADPALRRIVYDYMRSRNQFLTGITKAGEVPGTTVSKEMVGRHDGVPVRTGSDPEGRPGNDFFWVSSDGVVHNRTAADTKRIERWRAKEVESKLVDGPPAPVGDPDKFVRLRKTISGMTLRTGEKLGDWFYNLASFSPESKANARQLEQAIANGDVVSMWYQAVGTGRGATYAESLRKGRGSLSVTQRRVLPFAFTVSKTGEIDIKGQKVKTGGNVVVALLDLSTAERKALAWQGQGKLDMLWSGDTQAFLADLQTYLKNHAEGRPGADTIGEAKRDAINALVIGANVTHEARNPFRLLLRGEDRGGIVRTFRLDRIEGIKLTGERPGRAEYDKKVLNLAPADVPQEGEGGDQNGQVQEEISPQEEMNQEGK